MGSYINTAQNYRYNTLMFNKLKYNYMVGSVGRQDEVSSPVF